MRKIFMVLVVLGVAGIVGLLFNSWENSIEYQKRKYRAACSGYTWMDMARYGWAHVCGRPPDLQGMDNRRAKRIALHESALIKSGYLEERTFFVSDSRADLIRHKAIGAWSAKFRTTNVSMTSFYTNIIILGGRERDVIARTYAQRTNGVVIVAPTQEMRTWEKLISEAGEWVVGKTE